MHGYMRPDGRYYETDNGPSDPSDLRVPLRPSEIYEWRGGRWVESVHRTMLAGHAMPHHQWPRHEDVASNAGVEEQEPAAVRPEKVRVSLTIPQLAAIGTMVVSSSAMVWKVYQMEEHISEQTLAIRELARRVDGIDRRVAYMEAMRGIFSGPQP